MRDRTEDIRSVVSSYESLDFVAVRLENAFDDAWWQFVGGKPSSSDLKIDISHEGGFLFDLFKKKILIVMDRFVNIPHF